MRHLKEARNSKWKKLQRYLKSDRYISFGFEGGRFYFREGHMRGRVLKLPGSEYPGPITEKELLPMSEL